MSPAERPTRVVAVTGTGTAVGKTWWSAALARELRGRGTTVAARKPAQSFDPADTSTDADVLGAATGEAPEAVCPPRRWLEVAMAPPMAAVALGRPAFRIADLVGELVWQSGIEVGLVEGAGGLRSPLADDGDTLTLITALDPDDVLVVAPTGLGVIHGVRLVVDALGDRRVTVALNHFDPLDALHTTTRRWLEERDGVTVATRADELAARWA